MLRTVAVTAQSPGYFPVSRFVISPPHLYAILDREFRAQRPVACDQCRAPLPFWREPPDEVSANWEVGTPAFCKHGCHLVFAELLTALWTKYDLQRSPLQ
jgi:hypothetical protein